ncbi:glucokinase [Luteimonas aquatica]|uniref:glucokinase n=1 Tax=Luteimonas aquatica TaxID=450364 RepID=UPI001F5702AC|nr:glucokinase [Luteimonas aquatica]
MARSQTADATNAASRPFIAADVGGTHVRIGLVRPDAGAPAQALQVLGYRKYACADFAGLAEIIEDFLGTLDGARVDAGAIASAGYLLDDADNGDGTLITANLPWPVPLRQIRERLGFREFRLVNDFEAVAHAAAQMDASAVLRLTGPDAAPRGPTLVVGPGTGFGAALWIPSARGPVVLATEAGHAALTVGNDLEMAVLRHLLAQHPHVPVEQALSGPGLMHLYGALCALHGAERRHASPGEITAAALSDGDAQARESLSVFCGLLGGTVGDMALLYGAQAIYLAGGILPQIREFLLASGFVERFLNKGVMREALERVPVKLVEHGQLGVIGAAHWFLASGGRTR